MQACLECGKEVKMTDCQVGLKWHGDTRTFHATCGDIWASKPIPVWTIQFGDAGGYCEADPSTIENLIRDMDVDSEMTVTRREPMTQGEYCALPEWTGP